MHVGDEFFLSLLHPRDHLEDKMITYDNFVDCFKKDMSLINIKARFTGFERVIFNSWKITKQFRYIDLLRQQNNFQRMKKIFLKPY